MLCSLTLSPTYLLTLFIRLAFELLNNYYDPVNGLKGLVVDLRGNPGGLLDAAVEISSYLVPSKSEIVSAKSKNDPEIVYKR